MKTTQALPRLALLLAAALSPSVARAARADEAYDYLGLVGSGGAAADANGALWATATTAIALGYAKQPGWVFGLQFESKDVRELGGGQAWSGSSAGASAGYDWEHIGIYGRAAVGNLRRTYKNEPQPVALNGTRLAPEQRGYFATTAGIAWIPINTAVLDLRLFAEATPMWQSGRDFADEQAPSGTLLDQEVGVQVNFYPGGTDKTGGTSHFSHHRECCNLAGEIALRTGIELLFRGLAGIH